MSHAVGQIGVRKSLAYKRASVFLRCQNLQFYSKAIFKCCIKCFTMSFVVPSDTFSSFL